MKIIKTALAPLSAAQLVEVHNLLIEKKIKKFESKNAGLDRVEKIIAAYGVTKDDPDGYANFFGDFAIVLGKAGITLPDPPAPEPEPEPEAPKGKSKTVGDKVSSSSPQLNLRCPLCGFFAKTNEDMMAKGRLLCPVDKNMLLTAAEREETRGKR